MPTNTIGALDALLAQYESLRDECLKSIEWRHTLFSAGFGSIIVVAGGAIALNNNLSNDSSALLFTLSYVIPVICIFVLISWMGEAIRCQRVSYFIASDVEPQINEILERNVMRWEIGLNSGAMPRDEMLGPSMFLLGIVGLVSGICPIVGVVHDYDMDKINFAVLANWIYFPHLLLCVVASYVAGNIKKIANVPKIEPIGTGYYHKYCKFSFRYFFVFFIIIIVLDYLFVTISIAVLR